MITYRLYVVDDEESIRTGVSRGLGKEHRVRAFGRAEEALAAVAEDPPDLVLLDVGLPGMNGIDALGEFRRRSPETLVVMVTAFEDLQTVIAAMRLGARDYVVKPIHMDALRVTVRNALETLRLRKEVEALQEKALRDAVPGFVAESDAIQDVVQLVEKVARSPDAPVLIAGETGTGKELIASLIHHKSPRFEGPFVALNCASIPKDLLESELFGYERGAFSGAGPTGKAGLVEQAEGGTLFLDEVGELSPRAQAELLRFLESREYYRVGGTRARRVDTRVVSATNRDLAAMIEKGTFREDLFFRLSVVRIEVPSLDQRPGDIPVLARFFLQEFNRKYGRSFSGFTPEAAAVLETRRWKGNIRELRNLVERGVLVGEEPELTLSHLGLAPAPEGSAPAVGAAEGFPALPPGGIDLAALEAHYLKQAYERAGGNEARAAEILNMSYYAYRYRRKKLRRS